MDAYVQVRRMYHLLSEVMDMSRQLAEAVDRNDQISIQMVLAMREEPIQELTRIQETLRSQMRSMTPKNAKRLRELLEGSPANAQAEVGLANQIATNARLLTQILELDERLSYKIARDKSVYLRKNSSP